MERVANACRRDRLSLAFVSCARAANFDLHGLTEMDDDLLTVRGYTGDQFRTLGGRLQADVVVNACNIHPAEEAFLRRVREAFPDDVVVSWHFDNHHDELTNLRVALASDVVFAAHAYCQSYLVNTASVLAGSLPLCCTQWGARLADHLYDRHGRGPRSDALYGGFVAHDVAPERNHRVRVAMREVPGHAIRLLASDQAAEYYGQSLADRFREWAAHKVSFNPAVRRDLSTRVFDSLIAGLVPIVPDTTVDLDAVVSPSLQAELPIVRYPERSRGAVVNAYRQALRRYDADGQAGADRRHRYAVEHHTLPIRIRRIVEVLRGIARGDYRFDVGVQDRYDGWYGAVLRPSGPGDGTPGRP